jgi:lipoyl(octanoyl) transferase
VRRLGVVPYAEALALQRSLVEERRFGRIGDTLLLLEHPPTYTRGRRAREGELPFGEAFYRARGIEVHATDRGGRVTYHGPGQLVAYPIVSLRPYGDDVHEYVRRLERTAIGALGAHGVGATTIEDLTGVWTEGEPPGSASRRDPKRPISLLSGPSAEGEARKIGSIGVHVSRGITTHGLAINVNNDLQPFEWIVPCGIEGCRVTSLGRELGAEQDLDAFADTVAAEFGEVYERTPAEATPAELGLDNARLGIA